MVAERNRPTPRRSLLKDRLGWKEKDVPVRRMSDQEKLPMAARLRTETVLSIPRIAVRLHRGGAKLASWMKANTHQAAQSPTETRIIDRKLQFDSWSKSGIPPGCNILFPGFRGYRSRTRSTPGYPLATLQVDENKRRPRPGDPKQVKSKAQGAAWFGFSEGSNWSLWSFLLYLRREKRRSKGMLRKIRVEYGGGVFPSASGQIPLKRTANRRSLDQPDL